MFISRHKVTASLQIQYKSPPSISSLCCPVGNDVLYFIHLRFYSVLFSAFELSLNVPRINFVRSVFILTDERFLHVCHYNFIKIFMEKGKYKSDIKPWKANVQKKGTYNNNNNNHELWLRCHYLISLLCACRSICVKFYWSGFYFRWLFVMLRLFDFGLFAMYHFWIISVFFIPRSFF